MPTYEYECIECGAVVEIFHSMAEPARKKLRKTDPKSCECNARVQRRIGTGAGVIFKGSGSGQRRQSNTAEVTIVFNNRLTSHPCCTNSTASQSSRRGWVGGWPWLPKSSGVVTNPRPKHICHSRLTATRTVSG